MSNHYGNDDELRSITFRDGEDGDDLGGGYGSARGAGSGSRRAGGSRADRSARSGDESGYRGLFRDEYPDDYPDERGQGYGQRSDRYAESGAGASAYDDYGSGGTGRAGGSGYDEAGSGYDDATSYYSPAYDQGNASDYDQDYRQDYRSGYDDYDRDPRGAYDPYGDEPPLPPGPGGRGAGGGDGRRRRSRTRTTLLVLLALVLMMGGGLVLTGYLISEKIGGQAHREDTFGKLPEKDRAQKPKTGPGKDALNFLLAGTDARTGDQKTTGKGTTTGTEGGRRSDTIMLVHITADRSHVYLISIPRDSYVNIPGHGKNKINAAYAFGGSSLYVETLEQLTHVRMDHYAAIDWNGFRDLTNALGGVTMDFPEPITLAGGKRLTAGEHTLTGDEALLYVRERHALQHGDFDRIKRQQNFLRSLMRQTLSAGTLTNPVKLTSALSAVTNNLSVDEKFSTGEMRSLALQMRNTRSSSVTFMTAPLANPSTGMVGSQSVVFLDMAKAKALFDAVKNDHVDKWIAQNNPDLLGKHVN